MSETDDSTGEGLVFQDAPQDAPPGNGDDDDDNNNNSPNTSNESGTSSGSGGTSSEEEEQVVVVEQDDDDNNSEASSEAYAQARTDQELFASSEQQPEDDDESDILFEPDEEEDDEFEVASLPFGTTQPHEVRSLLSGDMLSSSGIASAQQGDEESSGTVVLLSESDDYSEAATNTMLTPRASNRRHDRSVRLNVKTPGSSGGGSSGGAAVAAATADGGGDAASTASDTDWELRHLLTVLGLTGNSSRRRMRGEGIESVGDLYDIETQLREGRVRNLKSVETAKLLHFLDWVKTYQTKANGCLPEIERHFTTHEYERFIETRRKRNYSHVWPFMAIDEDDYETRILSLPVTYSLNVVTSLSTDPDGERIGIAPASPTTTTTNLGNLGDISGISAIHVAGIDDSGEAGVSAFRAMSSARIRDNFIVAEEAHARFQFEARSRRRLQKAMEKYRLVVGDTALTVEDCMIQAFSCIKLAILLRRAEFKNENESLDLFRRAAEQFKVPTAMFFYGFDLVVGRGSAEQNVSKGISLLDSAASAGIGEAYFVLGSIHEGEIEGVRRDLHAAQRYYETTSDVFQRGSHRAWLGLFRETSVNPSMPIAGMINHWDAELSSSQNLVQVKGWCDCLSVFPSALGAVCDWVLLAQTFLLSAAALLTRQSQTEHYSLLLPAIPVLGILLSLLSTTQALAMIWCNRKQRAQIHEMQSAKSMALRRMLKVPMWNTTFVPPLHYVLLFHCYVMRWFYEGSPQYCRTQLEALDAKILWLEARGQSALALLWSSLVDLLVLLVALAFLSTWIALLIQETMSHQDECSNWWENTCQGSMVQCNEEEQKLGTCFFFGPGGATLLSAEPPTDFPS